MGFRLLIGLLVTGIWAWSVSAATIEEARADRTNQLLFGVTVEGEIQPGDTTRLLSKLLEFTAIYGPPVARIVFLMSKGGNAEEAMKMGTTIRRLRLETAAPLSFDDRTECRVALAYKDNCICASACFLAYAGGVRRDGNFLALHRPYLPKQAAGNLSDLQYEAAEKEVMVKVREYLHNMEVDQFFIDKMMSPSSQDSYVVTLSDMLAHRLDHIVPSMEEIVLTKCNVLNSQEERILESTSDKTPAGHQVREQLIAKWIAGHECQQKVLDDIRAAAFDRELDAIRGRP